jgi:dTDP-4-amino-4,6-dideoxygalactose transaminase
LCDLHTQFSAIGDEVRLAIDQVLESQAFILGPQVAELEEQIAAYCGCRHAVGCSSGSDALLLALMALGLRPGDEVITSPFTFFATAGAVARLEARPVFVDIEPKTFNLDPDRLEAAVTARTKAIIPVHLFGQMADMAPIMEIANKHDLAVVEDAAQAIGAEYRSRRAGSIGCLGCFSFFPSKNLGAAGDGGMITTNHAGLAEKSRVLRVHGAKEKYYHAVVGGNFRLDTLQAAVLLVKFRYLESWNDARRACAARYHELLSDSSVADEFVLPVELSGRRHVYNQFVVRMRNRDRVRAFLKRRAIESAVYYPRPLHLQGCFAGLSYREGDFPSAERACREVLALPMFPELSPSQQAAVVSALVQAVE